MPVSEVARPTAITGGLFATVDMSSLGGEDARRLPSRSVSYYGETHKRGRLAQRQTRSSMG